MFNMPTGNASSWLSRMVFRGNDNLATFRFVVELNNRRIGAFTECKLPNIDWQIEKVKEGGQNEFTHQLPGQRKPTKITLKRGLGVTRDLTAWYVNTMNERIERKRVTVILMNTRRQPAITWSIEDAYPIKWTGLSLKTKSKTVAVETLVLACGRISVTMV
jgi:phage tail-like protein